MVAFACGILVALEGEGRVDKSPEIAFILLLGLFELLYCCVSSPTTFMYNTYSMRAFVEKWCYKGKAGVGPDKQPLGWGETELGAPLQVVPHRVLCHTGERGLFMVFPMTVHIYQGGGHRKP